MAGYPNLPFQETLFYITDMYPNQTQHPEVGNEQMSFLNSQNHSNIFLTAGN
ncbi:hypothetical protein D3C80_2160710 [compost metagenome]